MPQKPLELTVQEAMNDISGHSMASLAGLVTVHSSVFRNGPLKGTYVSLNCVPGPEVADRFGSVNVPVVSEHKRGIDLRMAKLVDGVRVRKAVGKNFICYSLEGETINPFNRGWLFLGLQTYHYSYSARVDFAAVTPAVYCGSTA